ncbi:MAG: exonuclease subunit SbcD [Chloroflexi bacterium]|nr:MAG: exonuclease subunit SbcD [Chloroflexota bacterium]
MSGAYSGKDHPFMRILHTSDLHVGRTLSNISLLEDQAAVLNQIADIAHSENVDVVIIAGDLYDRAVPSAEAVALVDRFLVRLVVRDKRKVLAIAGNHDSPERIGFTANILKELDLHLRGTLEDLTPVVINDAHGPVAFHLCRSSSTTRTARSPSTCCRTPRLPSPGSTPATPRAARTRSPTTLTTPRPPVPSATTRPR